MRLPSDWKEIVHEFLENRQIDIESLKYALESNDFETIKKIGHALKGSGGSHKFDTISEIGAALEKMGMEKEDSGILAEIEKLIDYLSRVEIEYEKES